jgi:hypothetical protein
MRPLALGTLATRAWHHAETPGETPVACNGDLALDVVSARQSDSGFRYAALSQVARLPSSPCPRGSLRGGIGA